MIHRLTIIVLVLCAALSVRAETIDRVVATVNGHPILQSDVDEAVRYEAFVEGKPLNSLSSAQADATLQRLVDQELLHQQMSELPVDVAPETLQEKIGEIRKERGDTPEQWQRNLAAYGLDEDTFTILLKKQLQTMAFVDHRLRPSIVIDRVAVETYYRNTFLPQLRKSGATREPAFNDVQQKIREVLTQQRVDDMLSNWLRSLRQQARVRILVEGAQVASSGGGTATN